MFNLNKIQPNLLENAIDTRFVLIYLILSFENDANDINEIIIINLINVLNYDYVLSNELIY